MSLVQNKIIESKNKIKKLVDNTNYIRKIMINILVKLRNNGKNIPDTININDIDENYPEILYLKEQLFEIDLEYKKERNNYMNLISELKFENTVNIWIDYLESIK